MILQKNNKEMNINENIKQERKKAGMTQKELAEKLSVYQKDVSRWETGERTPSIKNIYRICEVLDIPINTLLK